MCAKGFICDRYIFYFGFYLVGNHYHHHHCHYHHIIINIITIIVVVINERPWYVQPRLCDWACI